MTQPTTVDPAPPADPLYDALTGLPSPMLQRAHLVQALKRAARSHTQVALLFLDVDDFRSINGRLGRDVGDAVLREVAARLQGCLRDTDVTARLDGDEFAIVCEDLHDPEDVEVLTRRVCEAIAPPFRIDDELIELKASVGSAVGGSGHRPGDLLSAADHVMSRVKREHRA